MMFLFGYIGLFLLCCGSIVFGKTLKVKLNSREEIIIGFWYVVILLLYVNNNKRNNLYYSIRSTVLF